MFRKYFIWFLLALFSFLYSFVAIVKHNHFQTGLDLAIYVQSFWNYINLQLPRVTLYPTYGDMVWADHFTPSLIFLAPFYKLWPDARALLIIQGLLFVLGGYPIYRFAKETLKSEFLSLSLVLSYLLFFGTQFALTFDFHAATFSASFLPWLFWFCFNKNWKLFLITFFGALGGKEDMPLLLLGVSLFLILSGLNRKLGIILSLISLSYLLTVTKVIMPNLSILSAKTYTTPVLPQNPVGLFAIFLNSPIKIRTIFLSFLSFSFLPIFSGWFLILPVIHFFINFINTQFMGRWDIYLHYRVHLASILSFAAILGIKFICHCEATKWPWQSFLGRFPRSLRSLGMTMSISVLLILSTLFLDYFLHLPLNSILKKNFYREDSWMKDNYEVMAKIPQNAYLLTQNNLLAHVANRKNIFTYPKNLEKADFIFLDLHPGQPVINFWLSNSQEEVKREVETLVKRGVFEKYYQKEEAILLKKIVK